jgi:hypothetical protein
VATVKRNHKFSTVMTVCDVSNQPVPDPMQCCPGSTQLHKASQPSSHSSQHATSCTKHKIYSSLLELVNRAPHQAPQRGQPRV